MSAMKRAAPSTARTGALRTYLGIAPGVGKTYAMLRDGRARRRSGVDVVVAYLERHGRPATAAQLADLELLATRTVEHHGAIFEELDVAAALARRPELVLVDELAHANVDVGGRATRFEDVSELLAAGVDVYTTLNVANVASLADVVARVTGVPAAEPVPDEFVRAGEVVLVDLAPDALRHRLAAGVVFPPDRAGVALASYFRFANLAALRDLAELWLDDSVGDAARTYLERHPRLVADEHEKILVGLAGSPSDEWLIRYAARLAELSGGSVLGVHVAADDNLDRLPEDQLEADRRWLADVGATYLEVKAPDPASGLVAAAARGASQLVLGCRGRSRWSRLVHTSTVQQVLREVGNLPVQLVNVGRSQAKRAGTGASGDSRRRPARASASGRTR